jgi:hypothetical protein
VDLDTETMTTQGQARHEVGAILPDGRINVSKLEREIANELANDSRFIAEDGMKKRAVHMSHDYNEFRNFVAASQLKPVQSSEMGQLFVQQQSTRSSNCAVSKSRSRIGPNKVCREKDNQIIHDFDLPSKFDRMSIHKKKNGHGLKTLDTTKHSAPRNAMELEREWRKWCKTPVSTLKYLLLPSGSLPAKMSVEELTVEEEKHIPVVPTDLRLSPETVARFCRVEMDSSMMEAVLEALHYYMSLILCKDLGNSKGSTDDIIHSTSGSISIAPWNFIYMWIMSITKCGRFDLNVDFFEAKHNNFISSTLKNLEKLVDGNESEGRNLMFTGKNIASLQKKYRI